MNIAVILTCFNRVLKTVACLDRLLDARDEYNRTHGSSPISLSIFLTDDGCTDNTADAVRKLCDCKEDLHIIQGDGNCFWAGGMRLAWREALAAKEPWDFFLLLNDDTIVWKNVFEELLRTHQYAVAKYQKPGMYSGITCACGDSSRITYGGDVYKSSVQGSFKRLGPSGTPQLVEITNANILLVHKSVVDRIGIFPDCFVHSCADNDYSMMARRNDIPVLITADICGECEDDHDTQEEECQRLIKMSFRQRYKYVNHPLHSDRDYLNLIWRNNPSKYPVSWTMRKIRLYFPEVYNFINKKRGLY